MREHDIRPGDIVFVKTPNVFFEAMRRLYGTEYDHVILIVDEKSCLHISYPKAKLVPTS